MEPASLVLFGAGVVAGLSVGVAGCYAVLRGRMADAQEVAASLIADLRERESDEAERREDRLRWAVRDVVEAASQTALNNNSRAFLSLAETRLGIETERGEAALEERRRSIGEDVGRLDDHLEKVERLISDLERDRQRKFGELSQAVRDAVRTTSGLQNTTEELRRALSSSQARGQWGEYIAENLLNLVGLREGVDYERQTSVDGGGRPDFTFRLPKDLRVNMDVKFPFDNYWAAVNAGTDAERMAAEKAFLSDVRRRVKEVTTREYIDPRGGTVDYVIVFLANEQVFAFVQEKAPEIVDEAFAAKVVLCSPFTLYALLSVIRQAVEVFSLEQRSAEVLGVLAGVRREWGAFRRSMDKLGKRIEDSRSEYRRLVGVRAEKLDAALEKVQEVDAPIGGLTDYPPPGADSESMAEPGG